MVWQSRAWLVILPLLLVSCDERTREPTEAAEQSFPNSVGSQWVYTVYDSITGSIDTAQVDIVRTVDIGNGVQAAVWKYTLSDAVWYRYMRTADRRVLEYRDTNRASGNTLYLFPLEVGTKWVSNPSWSDTSIVVMRDTLSFPARVFENAVFVKRGWNTPGSSGRTDTWFVPKVGIVRLSLWSATAADTTCELWELISCKLELQQDSCSAR